MNNPTSSLDQWLNRLDALRLECDGMSRVISYLLSASKIEHEISIGTLEAGDGKIPLHYWITLSSGEILDIRARMWLGNDARIPHGLIEKGACNYIKKGEIDAERDDFMFMILAEQKPSNFLPVPDLNIKGSPIKKQDAIIAAEGSSRINKLSLN